MANDVKITISGESLMGAAISGVNASFAEMAGGAETTNASLAQTSAAMAGVEAQGAKLTTTLRETGSTNQIVQTLQQLAANGNAAADQIAPLIAQLQRVEGEGSKANLSIRQVGDEIKSMSVSVRQAATETTPWVDAARQLSSVIPGLGEGLRIYGDATRATTEAARAQAAASEEGVSSLSALGAGATIAAVGLVTAGAALAGTAVELTKLGAEWQHTMTSLGNAAQIPEEATAEIGKALADLSAKVPTSMGDLAKGLTEVAGRWQLYTGAALDAAGATELARAGAELAVATGQSYSNSLNALVTQQMAAGHGTEDLANTQDVLYNVSRLTGVSIDQQSMVMSRLQQRMGEAAPSINDVGLAFVMATNSGISGSRAFMAVSQALDTLTNGNEKTQGSLEELGIEVEKNADGTTNLRKLFEDLSAVWENTDPADRQKIATDLVGQAHGTLERMLDKSIGKMGELEEQTDKTGTAMAAAERHAGDLTERVKEMHNRFEAFTTMLGGAVVPKVLEFGDDLNNIVLGVGQATENVARFNERLGGIPAALASALPGLREAMNAINIIRGGGGSPEGGAVGGKWGEPEPKTAGGRANADQEDLVRAAYVTAQERKDAAAEAARAEKDAAAEAKREEKAAAAEVERERKAAVAEAEREIKRHAEEVARANQEVLSAQVKADAEILSAHQAYLQQVTTADATAADARDAAAQSEADREYDIWAQGEVKKLDDADRNALELQRLEEKNADELARIKDRRVQEDADRAQSAARAQEERAGQASRRVSDIQNSAAQSQTDQERHYQQSRQEAQTEHQEKLADIQRKGGPGMAAATADENQRFQESQGRAARAEQVAASEAQIKAAEQIAAAQRQAAEQEADAARKAKDQAADTERTRQREDQARAVQFADQQKMKTQQQQDQEELTARKLAHEQDYHIDAESKAKARYDAELARIDAKYDHDVLKAQEAEDLKAAAAEHARLSTDIKARQTREELTPEAAAAALSAEDARYSARQSDIQGGFLEGAIAVDQRLREAMAARSPAGALGHYAEGGQFTVPGSPGEGDNHMVQFMATPGETVSIRPGSVGGGLNQAAPGMHDFAQGTALGATGSFGAAAQAQYAGTDWGAPSTSNAPWAQSGLPPSIRYGSAPQPAMAQSGQTASPSSGEGGGSGETYNFDGMFRGATFLGGSPADAAKIGAMIGGAFLQKARGLRGAGRFPS